MDNLSRIMKVGKNSVVPVKGHTRFSHLGILNGFRGRAGVLMEFGGIASTENRAFLKGHTAEIGYSIAKSLYFILYGSYPIIPIVSKEELNGH